MGTSNQAVRFITGGLALLLLAGVSRATVITEYSFSDSTLNASTVNSNVTAGAITASPNFNNNPTVVLSIATSIGYATQPTLAAGRANNNDSGTAGVLYFSFTLTPKANEKMSLSSLTFNVAQGSTTATVGTRFVDVRSSADNYAATLDNPVGNNPAGPIAIPTDRPTFTLETIDLSAAAFQNLTSAITFRFVLTEGQLQNIDFDDITVNGGVVAVPEPAMLAIPGLGALSTLRRRRAR